MNKERLKEIKKELELDWSDVSYVVNQDDVKWLINRVEELEKEIEDWRKEIQKWQQFYKESEESHLETKELLKSILNQNKCYHEALESIRDMFPLRGGITYEKLSKIRKITVKALEGNGNA